MHDLDAQAAAAAAVDAGAARGGLAVQVADACASLSAGQVERDTEVRLLLLAVLSGEHLLLLGKPGTAKSELGRRLRCVRACGRGSAQARLDSLPVRCSALVSGCFFERLLTRFSVPEELFGPLSLRGLERDVYVRQTQR